MRTRVGTRAKFSSRSPSPSFTLTYLSNVSVSRLSHPSAQESKLRPRFVGPQLHETMSGPDYSQKSSAQIIEEQAASLNAKEDRFNKSASYDTHNTTTSDESGVNESGLSEFPGAEVHVGRTGYSGGGDNMVRQAQRSR